MDPDEYIIADKGFRGTSRTLIPFLGQDIHLNDQEKRFNNSLASVRIVAAYDSNL